MAQNDKKTSSEQEKDEELRLLKTLRDAKEKSEKIAEASKKGRVSFLGSLTDVFMDAARSVSRGIVGTYHTVERNAKNIAFLRAVFNAAAPVTRPVAAVARWGGGKIRDYYNFARTEREGEGLKLKWGVLPYYDKGAIKRDSDGDPSYSVGRFGRVLGYTAVAALAGVLALQAAYFYGTQFEETVYVTGKQEVARGEKYQFSGCTSLPCSTDSENGKYYTIDSSLYLPALWFPDQDVYANIGTVGDKCDVKGYGIYERHFRFLHKELNFWQNIYSVSCQQQKHLAPIDGQVSQSAPGVTAAAMTGPG